MHIESGIYTPVFRGLRPVFEEWIGLMCDRDGWTQRDAPWWYNKRANVSQLAGAVWRTPRGWAFEEYAARKKQRCEDGTLAYDVGPAADRGKGRVDLAIELPSVRLVAETKQLWRPASNQNGKHAEKVRQKLDTACEQVRAYPTANDRYQRVGIVFVVPALTKRVVQDPEKADARLLDVVNAAKSLRVACAWAFPSTTRTTMRSRNKRFYPGAVVCAALADE